MYVEHVSLRRFCGFEEYELDLDPVTVLVGPNNGGKTTILQAVRLVFEALRIAFGPDAVPNLGAVSSLRRGGLANLARRCGIQDATALYLARDPQQTATVSVVLAWEGKRVGLDVRCLAERDHYEIAIRLGDQQIRGLEPTEQRRLVNQLYGAGVAFVPPPGYVGRVERVLTHEEMLGSMADGRTAETWRNQLHWLNEGKDPEFFQRVIDRVRAHVGAVRVRPPRRSRDANVVEVAYVEDGIEHDIAASGGGVRTLLAVAAGIELSEASVLLFDEPDSHLHGAVQRDVARLLVGAATTDRQVLITTHSADVIEEVPLTALRWIDRHDTRARACDSTARTLVDLGALSREAALSLVGSEVLLYFEAKPDRRVFEALLRRLQKSELAKRARVEPLSGVGEARHAVGVARVLRDLVGPSFRMAVLLDADYSATAPDGAISTDGGALVGRLPCKELENLILMAPESIAIAVSSELGRRRDRTGESDGGLSPPTPEQVAALIDESTMDDDIVRIMKPQWVARWAVEEDANLNEPSELARGLQALDARMQDPIWRRRCAPGKLVLQLVRQRLAATYAVSVSTDKLFRHYTPSPEVVRLLDAVEEFLLADERR